MPMVWAQGNGREGVGRKARWRSACVDARTSANGVACKKWREVAERKAWWR